jgi:hypothetical protein
VLCFCRAGYRSAMTMLAVALLTTVAVSYHLRRVTPILPLAIGRTASTRLRSPAEKARNPPRQNTGSVQIPIAPDAPPSPHLPRFPPLEVCVRRPPGARRATFVGPPSANLHNRGRSSRRSACPTYPLTGLNAGLQEEPSRTSAMAFSQSDCGNGRRAIAKVNVQCAQPSLVRSMPQHR